jgi:hypothetical protein
MYLQKKFNQNVYLIVSYIPPQLNKSNKMKVYMPRGCTLCKIYKTHE